MAYEVISDAWVETGAPEATVVWAAATVAPVGRSSLGVSEARRVDLPSFGARLVNVAIAARFGEG